MVWIFQFKMPPLLLKDEGSETGIEHSIQIYINKIIEILQVLAGYWITGFIRIGKSIKKGFERPFQKLHKGLFYWIFSRPAEHGML